MNHNIAGVMHYDLLTDRARIANRPSDQDGMRAAALDLRASGLTVADIARALELGEHAVAQLLSEREAQ